VDLLLVQFTVKAWKAVVRSEYVNCLHKQA